MIRQRLGERATQKLIGEIGPRFKERNGGYTKILRLGRRASDGAEMAIIEFTQWSMKYTLDATNQSLGRLASKVAIILRGKNSASYTPNVLSKNEVLIINLKAARFTGNKFNQKK